MKRLFSFILFAAALNCGVAQNATSQTNDILARLDADAGALQAETNTGRFDYNLQLWLQHAQKIADATADSALWAYPYENIRLAQTTDTTAILYFCARRGSECRIAWLTTLPTIAGRNAYAFADNLKPDATKDHSGYDSLYVEPLALRSHWGFVVRNKAEHEMMTVGDVSLRLAFELVADVQTERNIKDRALELIDARLTSLLQGREALTANLSYLPRLMTVENDKQTVRLATYMATYDDFSSKCFGFIAFETEKGIVCRRLCDATDDIRSPEKAKLNDKKWFGAVYSSLVEVKFNKRTYYTLIGFKSNDGLVKTRVVDILTLAGDKCLFGSPLFLHEKATYLRRIFRYSANANMMVRFDDALRMLVFDHLSPSNSMFVGEFRHYGPDWSYDAYRQTKTGWEFMSDVEVRNR